MGNLRCRAVATAILVFCATVGPSHAAGTVVCAMPATALPGVAFTLTNLATPATGTGVYAIEDQIPVGWTASQLSHGGALDTNQWKLKWGPFFDSTPRTLTGRLTPPAQAEGVYTFSGEASFDGAAVSMTGVRQITVQGAALAGEVVCAMPAHYVPGLPFTVTNAAQPVANVQVYSVEDQVPAGWLVAGLSHGGVFDATNHKAKWGPFFEHTARELSYEITPPLTATGLVTFAGVGSFDGVPVPITGPRQTRPVTSTVVSTMPSTFQPTIGFTVTLAITATPQVAVYAVQDQVPDGWTVSQISGDGQFDATNRTVKWGPYFINAPATFSYLATPPAAADGTATFVGAGSFNGVSVPITGPRRCTAVGSSVVRTLPLTFLPGLAFGVANVATPAPHVSVYALEEAVPAGWSVNAGTISEGGHFDAAHRTVKWGPFFDGAARVLSYEATPPGAAAGTFAFDGMGSFDGIAVAVTGARQTIALPPAQANAIVRILPETLRAGASVAVTNLGSVAENVFVYALEETVPPGFTVSNITAGGFFDTAHRKIKWGPFFDNLPRTFTYRLAAPPEAGGVYPLTGEGSFDGQPVPIGGLTNLTVLPNHRPIARDDSLVRLENEAASVPLSKLLANDSDPDGDALTLSPLPSPTTNGAALTLSNGVVSYTPPAGFNGPDGFTYTVSDGFGGTASATVTVTVLGPGPGQNIKAYGFTNGLFWLRLGGVPGRTYTLQATDNLHPPVWVALGTRVAAANGEFEFVDPDPNRPPLRFYRSAWP